MEIQRLRWTSHEWALELSWLSSWKIRRYFPRVSEIDTGKNMFLLQWILIVLEQSKYFDGSSRTISSFESYLFQLKPPIFVGPPNLGEFPRFSRWNCQFAWWNPYVFPDVRTRTHRFPLARGFETTGLDRQRGGGHDGGSNVGFTAIMAGPLKIFKVYDGSAKAKTNYSHMLHV